jgi:hypothetical protein
VDNNYQIRDPDIEAKMIFLAKGIAQGLPETYGFALFIVSKDEEGNLFYVSSIERPEMVTMLTEWVKRNTA